MAGTLGTAGNTLSDSKQVDLEGGETEVAEGYLVMGKEADGLAKRCMEIAHRIPAFEHIGDGDIQAVKALHEKRGPKKKGKEAIHTFAECISPRTVFQYIAHAQGATLGPYVIVFYPPFFKQSKEDQEHTIIHELRHVKESKKGVNPHWGFGDNEVDALHKLIKQ